jgi:hypothetical protein
VHSSGRGGVLSPRTPTASGMALQCLGWRRGGEDGRTGPMVTGGAPHWSDVTVLTWVCAKQASVPLSRVPPSSFESAARRPYESG